MICGWKHESEKTEEKGTWRGRAEQRGRISSAHLPVTISQTPATLRTQVSQ